MALVTNSSESKGDHAGLAPPPHRRGQTIASLLLLSVSVVRMALSNLTAGTQRHQAQVENKSEHLDIGLLNR